jgi:hypothetical protein
MEKYNPSHAINEALLWYQFLGTREIIRSISAEKFQWSSSMMNINTSFSKA